MLGGLAMEYWGSDQTGTARLLLLVVAAATAVGAMRVAVAAAAAVNAVKAGASAAVGLHTCFAMLITLTADGWCVLPVPFLRVTGAPQTKIYLFRLCNILIKTTASIALVTDKVHFLVQPHYKHI
jgi:hypothetical protein